MRVAILKFAFAIFIGNISAQAQTYSIDGISFGGGGSLAGGDYSIDGAIPDFHPSTLSGGLFELDTIVNPEATNVVQTDLLLLTSYSNGCLTLCGIGGRRVLFWKSHLYWAIRINGMQSIRGRKRISSKSLSPLLRPQRLNSSACDIVERWRHDCIAINEMDSKA